MSLNRLILLPLHLATIPQSPRKQSPSHSATWSLSRRYLLELLSSVQGRNLHPCTRKLRQSLQPGRLQPSYHRQRAKNQSSRRVLWQKTNSRKNLKRFVYIYILLEYLISWDSLFLKSWKGFYIPETNYTGVIFTFTLTLKEKSNFLQALAHNFN